MERYNLVQVGSTRQVAITREPDLIENAVVYGGIEYDAESTDQPILTPDTPEEPLVDIGYMPYRTSGTRHGGFAFLEGSLQESRQISSMLENHYRTISITGPDGTEESFKALSGNQSPSIIHIATHGFYLPDTVSDSRRDQFMLTAMGEQRFQLSDDPLRRSALVLAGANHSWTGNPLPRGKEDGILTAREVSSMNLSNTQLVVMSACQTGLGDVKGSEGVSGLQRAFMMAGVRYIIMSLWSVPDKETAEFMELFYSHWLGGTEIRQAFQGAQREIHSRYPNEPYKWAAFVMVE